MVHYLIDELLKLLIQSVLTSVHKKKPNAEALDFKKIWKDLIFCFLSTIYYSVNT